MSFIQLNNLFLDSLKKAGIYRQVVSAMILDAYSNALRETFDSSLFRKVRPLYVKDGVVTVACLSPVVAQELKLREREILEKINSGQKKPLIQRIRYLM